MTAKEKYLLMQGIEAESGKQKKGLQQKPKRKNWRKKRVRMRFLAPMLMTLSFMFISSCTVCKLTGTAYPEANGNGTVKACVECTGNERDLKKILKLK